jgi:NhaA family Na+:H+ antiporter
VGNALHPWVTYGVVPVFALANAGIELSGDALEGGERIAAGVVAGLVIGKIVGVGGCTWLAVRLGLGPMPHGASWRHVVGVAALAGIGFTVSLFVAGLAFPDERRLQAAKIGILVASVLAAAVGALLLGLRPRDRRPSPAGV